MSHLDVTPRHHASMTCNFIDGAPPPPNPRSEVKRVPVWITSLPVKYRIMLLTSVEAPSLSRILLPTGVRRLGTTSEYWHKCSGARFRHMLALFLWKVIPTAAETHLKRAYGEEDAPLLRHFPSHTSAPIPQRQLTWMHPRWWFLLKEYLISSRGTGILVG